MITKHSIIYKIAQNKVAANVLLMLMFIAGYWGLTKLNTQFSPSFNLDIISVRAIWSSANSEDIEQLITTQVEEAIRGIDNIDKFTSASAQGVSAVTITFKENTDMSKALDDVKQKIDQLSNLPADAEKPKVSQVVQYETIADITLSSDKMDIIELASIARNIEESLLNKGIDKIQFLGYPKFEVAIELSFEQLHNYNLSLEKVKQQIALYSIDAPVGTAAKNSAGIDLRVTQQRRKPIDFINLPISIGNNEFIALGNIASIKYQPVENSVELFQKDKRSITIEAKRLESNSTLVAAKILQDWEKNEANAYRSRVDIALKNRNWELLEQRIDILINNGLSGLVLVVLVLMLFINFRTAIWVALGIPASLMLTMGVYYMIGGSINMLSLFAFILTLGIIVDDAIVVSEHAMYQFDKGQSPLAAALKGADRMFFPVLASSLTTVVAFLPLLFLSGVIGKFLVTIPMVAICVILASLVECFLVLPGHLHHSFTGLVKRKRQVGKFRQAFNAKFLYFRNNHFRWLIKSALNNRLAVIVFAIACLVVSFQMVKTGRVGFVFFPSIEANNVDLEVSFVAGTPQSVVREYLHQADKALQEVDVALGGGLVQFAVQVVGANARAAASNFGRLEVELIDGDKRTVSNSKIIKEWRRRLPMMGGLGDISIQSKRGGPTGKEIVVQLLSENLNNLKVAAQALVGHLKDLPGTSNFGDDLPFGKDQKVLELTPLAKKLGISVQDITVQIRNAFNGKVVQTYTKGKDEIEVRVRLSGAERDSISTLNILQIRLSNGSYVPLDNLVTWKLHQGFEVVRHYNGVASVSVSANVDEKQVTLGELMPKIKQKILPIISSKYNVDWKIEGTAKRQDTTFADMKAGLFIGLALMYIILVWVFGSWGWPLIVLSVIPFGLFGAVIGHYLLGMELTILSMLGMFGLSGIIINDSIVLVIAYRELKRSGMYYTEALVEAVCQRLRAVMLTSLTTILGLAPLLFETSLQAQFLIPMAITITFGLAIATFLILLLLPVFLSLYEQVYHQWLDKESHKSLDGKLKTELIS